MRLLLPLFIATLAACANEVTAPAIQPTPENSVSSTAAPGSWVFGRRGFGMGGGGLFATRRLPANLQLTDAQRAQIKSLMTAYRTAHQDDFKSMAAVMRQARASRSSGERLSIDQRRALFAQTAPARERLMAANKQLAAQIQQVLTADQKAWLASHRVQRGQWRARRAAASSSSST